MMTLPCDLMTPVRIGARAARILRNGNDTFTTYQHVGHSDRNRYPHEYPVGDGIGYHWPGMPVPFALAPPAHPSVVLEPEEAQHVRIRRLVFEHHLWENVKIGGTDLNIVGYVVGEIERHEGKRTRGYSHDDQGYLSVSRRVKLVEVLVPREDGPARLWMAWHEDLYPIEKP